MIEKILFLKKGIGIESKKVCKQVRDQKVWNRVKMELSDHRTKG